MNKSSLTLLLESAPVRTAQALGGCKDARSLACSRDVIGKLLPRLSQDAMDFMSFKTVFGPSAVDSPGDAGPAAAGFFLMP